jgi:hypothetical protein
MEERHIAAASEGEREEVRQIYRGKGFRGEDLDRAVAVVTVDRRRWVDTMMAEEHGQPPVLRDRWTAALSTCAAFLVCGAIPLLPFAVGAREHRPVAGGHLARVLRHRLRQEPLVDGELVAVGPRDARVGLAATGLALVVGAWLETLI